jgi:uncharacterized protein YdeI (BOF family)
MHRTLLILGLALGTVLQVGCTPTGGTVLGASPEAGDLRTTADARSLPEGTSLLIKGELVEKCPVSGCWFVIKDDKGTVKVDTKASGFVVVDVPLHRTLTVTGKTAGKGDLRVVDASGVRY